MFLFLGPAFLLTSLPLTCGVRPVMEDTGMVKEFYGNCAGEPEFPAVALAFLTINPYCDPHAFAQNLAAASLAQGTRLRRRKRRQQRQQQRQRQQPAGQTFYPNHVTPAHGAPQLAARSHVHASASTVDQCGIIGKCLSPGRWSSTS